jgi:hypothetical protein
MHYAEIYKTKLNDCFIATAQKSGELLVSFINIKTLQRAG